MSRAQLFNILRKFNLVCTILIAAILIPMGIFISIMGIEGSLGIAELETTLGIGGILILFAVILLVVQFFNGLILKILATSQSTVLIIFMIVLQIAAGLASGTLFLPLFYILALFLPKE